MSEDLKFAVMILLTAVGAFSVGITWGMAITQRRWDRFLRESDG